MQKGTVKWFNEKKGYGFIDGQGKDYFVHYKDIKKSGFKILEAGESVMFTTEDSPKGPLAKNVVSETL